MQDARCQVPGVTIKLVPEPTGLLLMIVKLSICSALAPKLASCDTVYKSQPLVLRETDGLPGGVAAAAGYVIVDVDAAGNPPGV